MMRYALIFLSTLQSLSLFCIMRLRNDVEGLHVDKDEKEYPELILFL